MCWSRGQQPVSMATPCLVSTDSRGEYSIRFLDLSKWHPINMSHSQHFCLGLDTKEKETCVGKEDGGQITAKGLTSGKLKLMFHVSREKELRKF